MSDDNDQKNPAAGRHEPKTVFTSAHANLPGLTGSIALSVVTFLSIQHVQAAAFFSRQAFAIEEEYGPDFMTHGLFPPELSRAMSDHQSCVIAAIYTSSAFLEATIHELFFQAAENPTQVSALDSTAITKMTEAWHEIQKIKGRKYNRSTFGKFDDVLAWASKKQFDPKDTPHADITALIELRNALTHSQPEFVTVASSIPEVPITIENFETLLSGKFALNRLTSPHNVFFPSRVLGHGCAAWALNSSVTFVDDFFARINVKPAFDHVRSHLETQ
jgi:hypothetical protein